MSENFEIIPLVGFGELKFGQDIAEIMKQIGQPDETDEINNDDEFEAVACNYWEKGFTLFFEGQDRSTFSYIETDNQNATLFGKKVFTLNEKAIIEVMNHNGYKIIDVEDESWGEKRLSFDEGLIDFYFDNETLISVSWGIFLTEDGKIDTLQD